MTIDKVCGSGLKAVMLAAQAIKCGDASLVVVHLRREGSAKGNPLTTAGERYDAAATTGIVAAGVVVAAASERIGPNAFE